MPLAPAPPHALRPAGLHLAPHRMPLLPTRQLADSLSDENRLLIRCAWAGIAEFVNRYVDILQDSWSDLGACSPSLLPQPPSLPPSSPMGAYSGAFTTKAELWSAVKAYNADPVSASSVYGLIAEWDVSMITDMSYLFKNSNNFNANISSWDTSRVTTMQSMFYVRSARALAPRP